MIVLDTHIPDQFDSYEAAAAFWDTHSLADYWDQTEEVNFDVDLQCSVVLAPLEHHLADELKTVARKQGLSVETLVNLWLWERVRKTA